MPDIAPVEMVVLQGTPYCNLNCTYCDLSVENRKQRHKMSSVLQKKLFEDLFSSDLSAEKLAIVWHSGEPLTLPPEYYETAIQNIIRARDAFAKKPVELEFDFQTNGVLIDESWVAFFHKHASHLNLGVSCDGPEVLHDAFRRNWGGRQTHSRVEAGMKLLRENSIPFKVIAVVSDKTLEHPGVFFDYFQEWSPHLSGFHFNILANGASSDLNGLKYSRSDRDRYYRFYRYLLKRANDANHVGKQTNFQNFSQSLGRLLDQTDRDYVEEASLPLRTLNMDAKGEITTFYAGLEPGVQMNGEGIGLGNISDISLDEMIRSVRLLNILGEFRQSQSACKAKCEYYDVCPGGFELAKLAEYGHSDGTETVECAIVVKALVDALLDDIAEFKSSCSEVADQAASRIASVEK